ncbi:sensor histidine kinase [Mariniphaga anaerophila]|uniref:sensor histidine kinase n=1 Tax=Mariniphaga anaerophila TaxID=1484053 RepID=UPI001587A26A|nr:sensor histidine kinase [Mariniphaga anaerophila]
MIFWFQFVRVSYRVLTGEKLVKISQKNRRILTHVAFWAFYILFFGSVYGKYGHDFQWYFLESLCMLPFVMAATYITVYGILPFYLRTRKLAITVLLMVTVLLLVTLGERIFLRLINGLPVTSDSLLGVTFLYLFLETNFMVAIAFAIKIVKKWFEQQTEKHEMEKQNLKKELQVLKAQLQPHFLFNTMNNLYSLSLAESAKTSEGIAQMAALLQSVLYECNDSEISLEKEVKLIENYIELERLRYGSNLALTFETSGLTEKRKIAPMLLFTFVENCFKHGGIQKDGKLHIHISVAVSQERLLFQAENSLPPEKRVTGQKTGGVGMANAKKRLEILYKGRYKLTIKENEVTWKVSLKLDKK